MLFVMKIARIWSRWIQWLHWIFTKFLKFKGLGVLALSRLNASNCHDHEILAIPNVLTTTNVRIPLLFCMRNRLKTIQIRQLFPKLASHLCDFDVLSKSKFGLRPEKTILAFIHKKTRFSGLLVTLSAPLCTSKAFLKELQYLFETFCILHKHVACVPNIL